MARFDDATAVRPVRPGVYDAALDPGFAMAGGAVHGGFLLAVLLRAATDSTAALPAAHPHPVATSASFLRVARPGPARVRVEPLKGGRTVSVVRATLCQGDDLAVDSVITLGALDTGAGDGAAGDGGTPDSGTGAGADPGIGADSGAGADPAWSTGPPPMPALADCLSFEEHRPETPPKGFAAQVDMRFDRATTGWLDGRPSGSPEMRAYFRLREPCEPDPGVLALAVDALPPVVFGVGAYGWAPTVSLTWHMRAVPAPGWLRLYGAARLVGGGWFDEDVEIWDSAGRLVAQGRQIARVGRPG